MSYYTRARLHLAVNFENTVQAKFAEFVGDFVNLWKRLSMAFKDTPNVAAYDLMNEPGDLPGTLTQATDRWQSATMQALDAIRANGDGHLVMIPMYHKHGTGTGTALPRSMELHPNGPWIEPMDRNIRYNAHWYPFHRSDEDGRMSYDEVNAFWESWGY